METGRLSPRETSFTVISRGGRVLWGRMLLISLCIDSGWVLKVSQKKFQRFISSQTYLPPQKEALAREKWGLKKSSLLAPTSEVIWRNRKTQHLCHLCNNPFGQSSLTEQPLRLHRPLEKLPLWLLHYRGLLPLRYCLLNSAKNSDQLV